jgi:hypothetical protein
MHESFVGGQFGISDISVRADPRRVLSTGAVERVPSHPGLSNFSRQVNGGTQMPLYTPHYEDPHADGQDRWQEAVPEDVAYHFRSANGGSQVLSSSARYGEYRLNHTEDNDGTHYLEATTVHGEPAGYLQTHLEEAKDGVVKHAPAMIEVDGEHQGKGLSRTLFRYGQMMSGGDLVHSVLRTPDGYGYSARVPDDPAQDPARRRPTMNHPTLF